MKVLWDEETQKMMWEMEDLMRKSYPHLFLGMSNFRGQKIYKVRGM